MVTVKRTVHFRTGKQGWKRVSRDLEPKIPQGRIPWVSKQMALAIRFDRLIREGVVADQSELARLSHVTQPRMTQIMNLLNLAPDIQEEILHLPLVTEGKDPIHEKMLRPICAEVDWGAAEGDVGDNIFRIDKANETISLTRIPELPLGIHAIDRIQNVQFGQRNSNTTLLHFFSDFFTERDIMS